MQLDDSATGASEPPFHCQRCGAVVIGEPYRHIDLQVCEVCYIDTWRPHHRKSHWCYLRSIKSDYLRPADSD